MLTAEAGRWRKVVELSGIKKGRPYKRSHLVALRRTRISANDPRSNWWPGER